jgi:hypothetical protein
MPEQESKAPAVEEQADVGDQVSVSDADTAAAASSPEASAGQASLYRRLQGWASSHPEAAATHLLIVATIIVAVVTAFFAIRSLGVASKALQDQTASDRMANDLQARAFASKVSLWGETTAVNGPVATVPDILHVETSIMRHWVPPGWS